MQYPGSDSGIGEERTSKYYVLFLSPRKLARPPMGTALAIWPNAPLCRIGPALSFKPVLKPCAPPTLQGSQAPLSPARGTSRSYMGCLSWPLWETWILAKHGQVRGVSTCVFKHRLRHLAIRDTRVAGLVRRLVLISA